MIFDKNDDVRNERILYQAKPNMLFGCKKAIYGIVLLVIVFILSPKVIQFVGNMQVYLISYINLALTRYAAIGFFIVILFIILFIIWQLIGWYSKEYILTQSRIIIKYGVLSTKKNYMPYAAIQDINTSQSVFGKIFNVGTISLFSAYDNNQMELSAISNPSGHMGGISKQMIAILKKMIIMMNSNRLLQLVVKKIDLQEEIMNIILMISVKVKIIVKNMNMSLILIISMMLRISNSNLDTKNL